jgi:cardiolipin synthase
MNTTTALLWIAPPVLLVISLLASAHALLNKRDSRAAFGWIAVCMSLPLGGPILYLIFGINRVNAAARRHYITKLPKDATGTFPTPSGTQFRPLSLVGENVVGKGLTACDEVLVLENGEALYPAMLEAIAQARHKVLLYTYLFDRDNTGAQFVDALCAARDRGLEVKVVIDGMGEWLSAGRIGPVLKRCGLEFTRFNPVTLYPPALNLNPRSPRKLLIIDNDFAFTGGANIGDRHLAGRTDSPHRVLDIHFRLRGRIVDELEWAFRRDWHYCKETRDLRPFTHTNPPRPDAPVWSRLVLDGPNKALDRLNDLMIGVISAAQQRVWIMTPYFLPGLDLIGALIGARLRGVDVQILLPGVNNIKPAHWASRNILRQVLANDIPIHYQPPPFIHSKLLLIDSNYSLIGSANMDPRSLRLNYELGVELFSAPVNAQLATYFEGRKALSHPVMEDEISKRPLLEQLRDSLAWLFSPYL